MAGGNEGDDVAADFDLAQPGTGLRILRLEQERKQVMGHRGGIVPEPLPPRLYDRVDGVAEDPDGRARLQSAEAWNEFRQAEKIERLDPPDGVEVGPPGGAHFVGIATEAIGEDGPLENIEGQEGDLRGNVDDRVRRFPPPALDKGVGGIVHAGRPGHDVPEREDGRKSAALNPPLLLLGKQEAVAERRRHDPALQRVLAIVGLIVEEHATDGCRLAHHRDLSQREVGDNDGLFEMRLCPSLERVLPQRLEERDQPERLRARRGRGRTEELSSGHPSAAQHASLLARQLFIEALARRLRISEPSLPHPGLDQVAHDMPEVLRPTAEGNMRNCLRFSDRPVVEPLAFTEIDRRPGAVYQSRTRALEPSVTDRYCELVRKTPDWKPNA